MPEDDKKPAERVFESQTLGYDPARPTPATPSDRAEWERNRHAEAIEFHNKQNERAGMEGDVARRNQYCPACRGVVDWKAEKCPHCGAAIEAKLRDYYNFSDFEAPVERSELLPILTAFLILIGIVGLLIFGIWLVANWLLG
ncbi:MAG: hypothetical protein ACKVS6_03805 [Planctomycetota bacterium]